MTTFETSSRERRDWTLLIFLIPIGVILMMVAGQIAIRLVPIWSVDAGMQSNLDPNNLPMQQNGPVQPISPAILTPLGWFDTFLTPGAGDDQDIVFPPFVVFEPTATPTVTASTTPPPTALTTTPTVTVTSTPTATAPPTITSTPTKKPTDEPTATIVPTETTVVPTTPVTPSATPTPIPVTSTPVGVTPTPPIDITIGTPNGASYTLGDNSYVVIDISLNPIIVNGSSDTNYDMVYYERENPTGFVSMDWIIVGISNWADGHEFYTVFNWGTGSGADMNSNVGAIPGAETDNQTISSTNLYATTGIAIDVDNAASAPPLGPYSFIVLQAPPTPPGPPGDGADIDAVQVIELSNPGMAVVPAPPPVEEAPVQPPAEEAPVVEEVPVEETPVEAPAEPAAEVTIPPAAP